MSSLGLGKQLPWTAHFFWVPARFARGWVPQPDPLRPLPATFRFVRPWGVLGVELSRFLRFHEISSRFHVVHLRLGGVLSNKG